MADELSQFGNVFGAVMETTERSPSLKNFRVLKKPIVTEKSSGWLSDRTVAFEVDRRASKTEIRDAVERVFGVKVQSVRTLTLLGKTKRTVRGEVRRAGKKKAYVTVAEGERLELVEGL